MDLLTLHCSKVSQAGITRWGPINSFLSPHTLLWKVTKTLSISASSISKGLQLTPFLSFQQVLLVCLLTWSPILDASGKTEEHPTSWRSQPAFRCPMIHKAYRVWSSAPGPGDVESRNEGWGALGPVHKGHTAQWGNQEANTIPSALWTDQRMFQNRCTRKEAWE